MPCAGSAGGQALDLGQQFHVVPLGRGVRAHAVEDVAPHGIGRLPVAQGVEVVPAEVRVEGEPSVDVRLVQRQRRLEFGALGVSERQDVVVGQMFGVERGHHVQIVVRALSGLTVELAAVGPSAALWLLPLPSRMSQSSPLTSSLASESATSSSVQLVKSMSSRALWTASRISSRLSHASRSRSDSSMDSKLP